jgi:hypothetical protein
MTLKTLRVSLKPARQRLCEYPKGYTILLKAAKKNKEAAYIGCPEVSAENGFPLEPGEHIELPQTDYTALNVVGKEGDTLHLLIWS